MSAPRRVIRPRPTITDHRETIDALIGEHHATSIRHSAPLEEAVRIADAKGDVEYGFHARTHLVRSAFFSSRPEKALVAFAWMRGHVERGELPEHTVVEAIVDGHFYVAQAAPVFTAVTREQIEAVLDDMEHDLQRFGIGVEPALMMRFLATMRMGDVDRAVDVHERWKEALESGWRCPICVADLETHLLQLRGERDAAIDRALRFAWERGECDGGCNIPIAIAIRLLVPLWEVERRFEAAELARWAQPKLDHHPDDLSLSGQMLEYLAVAGDLDRATAVVDRTAGSVGESSKDWYVFQWMLGLSLVAHRAADEGHARFAVRGLPDFPEPASDGYETAEVARVSERVVRDLGDRFDRRNGNDFHARWIAESLARLPGR